LHTRIRKDGKKMRVWIVGGGSIGLLYAAHLQAAGVDTVLVTRSEEQATAIAEAGITVATQDGQQHVACHTMTIGQMAVAFEDEELAAPDWILLTMKQYGITSDVLRKLGSICRSESQVNVLAMQNGIGHLELLSEVVPISRLFAAVVSEGAIRTSPTSVDHTGSGVTRLGMVEAGEEVRADRGVYLKQLQKVLQCAGFRCDLSNHLKDDIWHKLIINSIINPLTAILEIRNGVLLQHDSSLLVMRRLFDEALTVALHHGVNADGTLWDHVLDVCRKTARNRSSTWQDMLAGRPTELKWMNGAIVQAADRLGIKVPTHEMILQLMQTKEEIR